MNLLQIPVSAIRTAQIGMHTVSGNLANAATPGYHRQRVELTETTPARELNFAVGAGVTVNSVSRLRDQLIEQSLLQRGSERGALSAQEGLARSIEALLNPTDGSPHAQARRFFESWQDLVARPADSVVRRDVVSAAAALAGSLKQLDDGLSRLQQTIDAEIEGAVTEVNRLAQAVAELNLEIAKAEAQGIDHHVLSDRRDQFLTELAELVDVAPADSPIAPNAYLAAGGALLITTRTESMTLVRSGEDLSFVVGDWTSPVPPQSGRLAGLIESRTELLQETRAALRDWSRELVRVMDQQHALGVGVDGPFTSLSGVRGVADVASVMDAAMRDFPVSAGELTISLTELPTGERTVHVVSVDPGVHSLNDVLAQLNAIPGLNAAYDAASGRVSLRADQGLAFEFTGAIASRPEGAGWTSPQRPRLSGQYSGVDNDVWTITMLGSGTVGVSPGLQAEVRDGAGNVLAVLDVGREYSAGEELSITEGVVVRFDAGAVALGDTASLRVTARPDETGLLSALGLNSLFEGTEPSNFAVRRALTVDPGLLAAAASGASSGDNVNAQRLTALGDWRRPLSGEQTFEETLAELTAEAGRRSRDSTNDVERVVAAIDELEGARAAVSGVDENEELVRLLEFQRMFQAASRFIATVNSALDDLLNILR